MKVLKRIFIALLIVLSTFVLAFAWIKLQVSVTGMSAALVGSSDNLKISSSLYGTYGSSVALDNDFTLGCAKSTNGYEFVDESGNASTNYGQVEVYIKADTKREAKAKIVCDNPDPSMKVAITCVLNNNTVIFDADDFNKMTSLGTNFTNLSSTVTIRVWFDGDTATSSVAKTPFSVIFEAGETAI